jgi:hypothetical protein
MHQAFGLGRLCIQRCARGASDYVADVVVVQPTNGNESARNAWPTRMRQEKYRFSALQVRS